MKLRRFSPKLILIVLLVTFFARSEFVEEDIWLMSIIETIWSLLLCFSILEGLWFPGAKLV